MKNLRIGIILLILSTVPLLGCGHFQNLIGPDGEEISGQTPENGPDEVGFSGDTGSFQFGEDAQWPSYIPEEIPVLPGEIDTVMAAPDSHIRLFYSQITEDQIEEYITLLIAEGFNLEYRIYIQEGFPDNSEERRQRGEYDAIDITKGEFHMNLSHGAGTAVYDVYTSGFEDTVASATAIKWPEDLTGILPPPERCELVTIYPDGKDGYHITCKREDDNVDQDYLDLLLSLGFQVQETIQNAQGDIALFRMRSGDLVVDLSPLFGGYFTMQVSVDPPPQWPDVFESVVPRPERCELAAIIPTLSDKVHIDCNPQDENVLLDYIQVLKAQGFEEDHKFLTPSGEIMIIALNKGETTVDLSVSSHEIISVSVDQTSP